MPIYNGIEFFNESSESVIAQTFKDWELIVGINGHKPNSSIYNEAISISKDKRIKVYDMPEIKGKSACLNHMLELCNYDIICLLDVDDIWYKMKLEKQIEFKAKYDVISTNCIYFGDRKGDPHLARFVWYSERAEGQALFTGGVVPEDLFLHTNVIVNSSSMFNKSHAYWDENLKCLEDYDMWLRLASENKTFYMMTEFLVKHRIHGKSFFNNSRKQNKTSKRIKKRWRPKIAP